MKRYAVKTYKEIDALLERGVDYKPEQLVLDKLTTNMYTLPADAVTEIAKRAGFDSWTWLDWEKNGEIHVIFRCEIKEG